jgi:hypothetical protein
MAQPLLDLLNLHTQLRGLSPVNCAIEQGSGGNPMIEVDLRAAAYEFVREGVASKGRKSGVYKVLMPNNLAAKLEAARVPGENMSDVILRLAHEATAPADPYSSH